MAYDNNTDNNSNRPSYGSDRTNSTGDRNQESLYSKRVKAGKRRTYFFDVRATRGNDYFITITESKKRFDDNGYDRHKMFLYKEDFNKFLAGLTETINFVKTDLMPDFDFDAFSHENDEEWNPNYQQNTVAPAVPETEEALHTQPTVAPIATLANIADIVDSDIAVDAWKM